MGHYMDTAALEFSPRYLIDSNQRYTVICTNCSSTVKMLLTTPYGMLCSGCFKRAYQVDEKPIPVASTEPTTEQMLSATA